MGLPSTPPQVHLLICRAIIVLYLLKALAVTVRLVICCNISTFWMDLLLACATQTSAQARGHTWKWTIVIAPLPGATQTSALNWFIVIAPVPGQQEPISEAETNAEHKRCNNRMNPDKEQ
mmetsp:Transcript_45418/g.101909  ORF Transcript_45418/g.101909 Transcript_45418/m.101909 type:complete len:120 (+) Transcript_45418:351-710(+)